MMSVGVRDYIHVVDLAIAHVASLKKLEANCGCKVTYNIYLQKNCAKLFLSELRQIFAKFNKFW